MNPLYKISWIEWLWNWQTSPNSMRDCIGSIRHLKMTWLCLKILSLILTEKENSWPTKWPVSRSTLRGRRLLGNSKINLYLWALKLWGWGNWIAIKAKKIISWSSKSRRGRSKNKCWRINLVKRTELLFSFGKK